MKRLISALKLDINLQFNYGIYLIYTIITIFYIVILKILPVEISNYLTPFIIFSDPSFLGFFFLGGLVFFEKDEGTIEAIVVTPLSVEEYIISKVTSLLIIGLSSGFLIAIMAVFDFNYLILFLAISMTSILFTLIGFIAVLKYNTVNEYMFLAIPYLAILGIPILGYFGIFDTVFYYLIPSQASLILFQAAFYDVSNYKILYAAIYLAISIFIIYKFAVRGFRKYIEESNN